MSRALAEAARGRGAVEPNPMVGATVVRDGRLVAFGHHARFGGPHAEVVALERAGEPARGATLFVTLEPCCHQGKTPPCTEAILKAGVARVVAAMGDPFPVVNGGGLERLRRAGVAVDVGVEGGRARSLNAPYLKRLATGFPFVTAKWAMTLDGKIATSTGDSAWISGPRSRSLVHELRGRMDAVIVGIGTVLADDPRLTTRPPGPKISARVVMDSTAKLPPDSRLVLGVDEAPVWVAVTDRAPKSRIEALEAKGCTILAFPGHDRVPVLGLLEELGRRGATNVLVEGGGSILGAFLDSEQVDAVEVYVAPILEGGSHAFSPFRGLGVTRMVDALRLERHEWSTVDGDLHLVGSLPHPWLAADPP